METGPDSLFVTLLFLLHSSHSESGNYSFTSLCVCVVTQAATNASYLCVCIIA